MFALFAVHKIKPEHRDAFQKAIFDDAMGSIKNEPGCVCFDVLCDEKNPNIFCLYEAYVDRAAFDVHMKTPHVMKWQNTVKDFYAETPTVQFCKTLFPADSVWSKVKKVLETECK